MELDRFYPQHRVAFEFNGPQHYGPTETFSAEDAAKQRSRDYIKMGLCLENKVTLLVVHSEDLTLPTIKQKIGNLLPLRDPEKFEHLVNYLESVSRSYRQAARRGEESRRS